MPGFKNRAARKGSPDIVEGRTGLLEFLRPEENRVVVVREAGGIGVVIGAVVRQFAVRILHTLRDVLDDDAGAVVSRIVKLGIAGTAQVGPGLRGLHDTEVQPLLGHDGVHLVRVLVPNLVRIGDDVGLGRNVRLGELLEVLGIGTLGLVGIHILVEVLLGGSDDTLHESILRIAGGITLLISMLGDKERNAAVSNALFVLRHHIVTHDLYVTTVCLLQELTNNMSF